MHESAPPPSLAPRRAWFRRLFVVALVALAAGHPWLLSAVARFHVVELAADARFETVVIYRTGSDDNDVATAAALVRRGATERILLIDRPPDRLIRHGVVPPGSARSRRKLLAAGVPAERIEVDPAPASSLAECLRRLAARPDADRSAPICLLVDRWGGRTWSLRLDLERRAAPNVDVVVRSAWSRAPMDDDWWRRRLGLVALFQATTAWAHAALGGTETEVHEWDIEAYEAQLRAASS